MTKTSLWAGDMDQWAEEPSSLPSTPAPTFDSQLPVTQFQGI